MNSINSNSLSQYYAEHTDFSKRFGRAIPVNRIMNILIEIANDSFEVSCMKYLKSISHEDFRIAFNSASQVNIIFDQEFSYKSGVRSINFYRGQIVLEIRGTFIERDNQFDLIGQISGNTFVIDTYSTARKFPDKIDPIVDMVLSFLEISMSTIDRYSIRNHLSGIHNMTRYSRYIPVHSTSSKVCEVLRNEITIFQSIAKNKQVEIDSHIIDMNKIMSITDI